MTGARRKFKFTFKMHEIVANFICKLLETRPFSHLKDKMVEDDVKGATDNWVPGERATRKLVEWCQDQWRRKEPSYPSKAAAYSVNEPCVMPWFVDMPVCFNCGVPCPECRNELGEDIPAEMSTVHAIIDFDERNGTDEEDCSSNDNEGPSLSPETSQQPSTSQEPPAPRMTLRSSHKRK